VLVIDITLVRQRQFELERLAAELAQQRQIIETQAALLQQLGTPVIQVRDHVLLLPLIGALDSRRAQQVVDTLLTAISRAGAQVVILDITGVAVVDTSVASYLIRAVQAVKLLGCHSFLVGISPEIAQTLVGLGIAFDSIAIRATLQQALEEAITLLA
jgi:rsbT co-antagonist protein RsbR